MSVTHSRLVGETWVKQDELLRSEDAASGSPATTPSDAQPKPAGKVRHCWNCGAGMGFIENRYYDRSDTCESHECLRAARDAAQQERDEAHEQLDRDGGWGRY